MNIFNLSLAPKFTVIALAACSSLQVESAFSAMQNSHDESASQSCVEINISCAKTVSAAESKSGEIWFVWSVQDRLYVNRSSDTGKSFSDPIRITPNQESISTNSESRPQIALDSKDGVYVTWVKELPEKFTSEVRFSYSPDMGTSFSDPATVNSPGRPAGRSFNQLRVDSNGQVYIVWIDGRRALEARENGSEFVGTSIYFATANPSRGQSEFVNSHLIDGSCECCRLGIDFSPDGDILVMGREIYDDNIRDHGLLTISESGKLISNNRISFENWELNGCPHHGGGLVAQGKRTHMVWFSNAPDAGGLFYAYTDNNGETVSSAYNFAARETVPSRPYIARDSEGGLNVIWREFDGKQFVVKHMRSSAGETWSEPSTISHTSIANDYPFIINHPDGDLLLWHKPGNAFVLEKI